MSLEEIQDLAEKTLEINHTDLLHEALDNPIKHSRFIRMLSQEKVQLRRLDGELSKILREKHGFYNGKSEKVFDIAMENSAELKYYMEGDDDIILARQKIHHRKTRIEYIEMVCDLFKSRGFAIKNAIEMMKFNAGN